MYSILTYNNFETEIRNTVFYPGITAETVGDSKHIFEPNFNCGILGVALSYLDQVEEKDRELLYGLAINIFEEVRQENDKLILIGDEALEKVQYLRNILRGIFGEGNFSIVTTKIADGRKNPLTGSKIRSSVFSNESHLVEEIKRNPDAAVLSTIPYSDPRISSILPKLSGLENTKAYKTLGLLALNSDRRNHVKVAKDEIGHLGIINGQGEIFSYVDGTSKLVLKTIEGSAGGTGVNILLNEAQIEAFDKKANLYPYLVNKYIEPKFLRKGNEEFSFHIRPFFSSAGEYLGAGLKISGKSSNVVISGGGRNASQEVDERFNTSSGNSMTFIFDKNGDVVIGFVSKNSGYLGRNEASEFLKNFEFEGQKLTGNIINDLALKSEYIVKKVQEKTNILLGLN